MTCLSPWDIGRCSYVFLGYPLARFWRFYGAPDHI